MLDLDQYRGPKPRCLVTSNKLPNFLDREQPPRKTRPFSTLDILLPEAAAENLHTQLAQNDDFGTLHYSKVYMKLLDIISGDFFNTHIKDPTSSDILMLSEGRPGIDHVFSLDQGILRLEVDKATFEKLGLQGKPISGEGRKHVKARYAIELNLRLPNMVRGKPAFMRVVWAFENVLNHAVAWLFCDPKGSQTHPLGPLVEHQPLVRSVKPTVTRLGKTKVPAFTQVTHNDDYLVAADTLEWLSLAMSSSPRLRQDDDMDAYLSRYQVPCESGSQSLLSFSWLGLIPPDFAHKIFLAAIKAARSEWIAISTTEFNGESYTILVHDGQAVTWEHK